MLDDFIVRALIAGLGVAAVAGPFGCFVVWRRLAYFGDTLAHSALLGVALGLALQVNLTLAVVGLALVVAWVMLLLERRVTLSSDALLGLLSHASLALGLVSLSLMPWVRVDLTGLLFGDILSVSRIDLLAIYGGGIIVLGLLAMQWQALFAATVSEEIAQAEGLQPARGRLVFLLLLACVIALSMKIVGVLMITAMLIIPAATARRLSSGPEVMALVSVACGMVSVVIGLWASLTWDTPTGPSIVVASLVLFLAGLVLAPGGRRGVGERGVSP